MNSVNYYTPQIFTSIVSTGTKHSLLASGYRHLALRLLLRRIPRSSYVPHNLLHLGMGTLFFFISALLKTHPPPSTVGVTPPPASNDFVVSKVTPDMITNLGYKIFLMFATINIGAMATFAYFLPETKGLSLEEMAVLSMPRNVQPISPIR
ncbi:hypothetical protein H0H93_011525 [Arthromyces matolae]|nr:hypothetical protein H0H93_011525 [Arthromyces matolae]